MGGCAGLELTFDCAGHHAFDQLVLKDHNMMIMGTVDRVRHAMIMAVLEEYWP